MKILVMGAGGYIGIPLCEKLVALGHDVLGVDRFFFEFFPKCLTMHADIRDFQFGKDQFDVVVDLAGLSNDASSEIDSNLTKDINRAGALNFALRAKDAGARRYIYSSSASVYGHGSNMFLTETSGVNPLTDYARSKVFMEEKLLKMAGSGFEPVILRNATAFGYAPRMRFDLAVNVMAMRAITDKRILVMGGGGQYRPFAHVNDIVEAMCMAINADAEKVSGQIFNVGDNSLNMTITQLAMAVKAIYRDADVIMVPDDADKRSYHLSFRKIANQLGFVCNWSIEAGIREIERALMQGRVDPKDPRTITLGWYKSMMDWDGRLTKLRLNGRLL